MTDEEQKLIMIAYKEQLDKWKSEKNLLETTISLLTSQLDILDIQNKKTNWLKKIWYNNILKKPTPINILISSKEDEIYKLIMKHQKVLANEPKSIFYDIALYGGTLFKI